MAVSRGCRCGAVSSLEPGLHEAGPDRLLPQVHNQHEQGQGAEALRHDHREVRRDQLPAEQQAKCHGRGRDTGDDQEPAAEPDAPLEGSLQQPANAARSVAQVEQPHREGEQGGDHKQRDRLLGAHRQSIEQRSAADHAMLHQDRDAHQRPDDRHDERDKHEHRSASDERSHLSLGSRASARRLPVSNRGLRRHDVCSLPVVVDGVHAVSMSWLNRWWWS